MITFNEVNIQKGDRTVLENINWQAQNSENWAIIGGNGSGKSTFYFGYEKINFGISY